MADQGYMIVDGVLADNIADLAGYIEQLNKAEVGSLSHLATELRSETEDSHRQELYFALAEESAALLRAPQGELEAAYNLLLHILSTAPDFGALMPVILANLASEIPAAESQKLVILAVLGNLFNIIPSSQARERADVLSKVVDFSQASQSTAQLVPQLPQLLEWIKEWADAGVDSVSELTLKLYDSVRSDAPKEAFEFLVKAARSVQGLEKAVVEDALTNDLVWDFEDVLKVVKDTPELAEPLTQLANGNYAAFKASSQASPQALQKAQVLAVVRLSAAAAAPTGSRRVSYADIATAADLAEDDVEQVVIDACKTPLLKGRMDEFERQFYVESAAVVGDLKPEHWQAIEDRLTEWATSLQRTQDILRNADSDVARLSEYNQLLKA